MQPLEVAPASLFVNYYHKYQIHKSVKIAVSFYHYLYFQDPKRIDGKHLWVGYRSGPTGMEFGWPEGIGVSIAKQQLHKTLLIAKVALFTLMLSSTAAHILPLFTWNSDQPLIQALSFSYVYLRGSEDSLPYVTLLGVLPNMNVVTFSSIPESTSMARALKWTFLFALQGQSTNLL